MLVERKRKTENALLVHDDSLSWKHQLTMMTKNSAYFNFYQKVPLLNHRLPSFSFTVL